MIYVLGAVKPNVKQAAEEIGNRFGVTTIYGVAPRDGASDHPKGLALDFMIGNDRAKGDQIAAFGQQNYQRYGVTYIIWKQHIWSVARASEGWRAMPDRGSDTANHYDHVHMSFQARAGIGNSLINIVSPISNLPGGNPIGGAIDAAQQANEALKFVTDSHNWLRVGMFTMGTVLILVALVMLGFNAGLKPATARKVVKASVRTVRPGNA